jgi:amino acid transporter
VSSVVIGVASTAPGYSLAASLGGVAQYVGVKSPIIMVLAFIPMLFISYAYKALNQRTPDCGTSFTWVSQSLQRHVGWMTGWAIVAADIIVMAALAQIAGVYGYLLFGLDSLAENKWAVLAAGIAWILVMTWISYRGIEISARTQYFLLGAELIVLLVFSVVALLKVYTGDAGTLAIHPSLDWFNPFGMTFAAFSAAFLLAIFIYWGWDTAVAANEETENPRENPGRAAVLSTIVLVLTYVVVTVAAQAFAGVGEEGIGLTNPDSIANGDSLSQIGEAVLGTVGVKALIIAVLTSAAASTQTTILPTARTTLAMAAYRALPKTFSVVHPKYKTPTVSTWAMGIVSIIFFGGLWIVNPGTLADLILSIGLMIAFYYGLTGLAAAWEFRGELSAGLRPALTKVILPLLGYVILAIVFVKTCYDLTKPDSGTTQVFGLGGAFVYGIGALVLGGILMIIYNVMAPAFFAGIVPIGDTVITESGEVRRTDQVSH